MSLVLPPLPGGSGGGGRRRARRESQFSERPFVSGTLTGLRAFTVDRLGRLLSPSYTTVFRPGENTATCHGNSNAHYAPRFYSMPVSSWDEFTSPSTWTIRSSGMEVSEQYEQGEPRVHEVGTLDCSCGWYAYFDGGNDLHKEKPQDRVPAIVAGYGVCTVGSRGFRASKSHLLALVEPSKAFRNRHTDGRWDRVVANYPDVPVYPTTADALAAHPLTQPEYPTPATDPDFWEL